MDEPHDRAFVWNMLGAIWTHKHHPELIDLPFAKKDEEAKPAPKSEGTEAPWSKADQVNLNSLCAKYRICDLCPLSNRNNSSGETCPDFIYHHPKEARRIIDDTLKRKD